MQDVRRTTCEERLLLAERLCGLAREDWERPSLCQGWTVRHVLAHLVTPFVVSAPAMAVLVVRRGGVAAAMDAAARRTAQERTPEELLDLLVAHAPSGFRPPGLPASAPLTDAVAHSADIRWALGGPRSDWGSPARLVPCLEFLVGVRARAGFVPPGRLRGLRLVAQDVDWQWGEGRTVAGPALALVMSVLGRAAAAPSLDGPGTALLLSPTATAPGPEAGRGGLRGPAHGGRTG